MVSRIFRIHALLIASQYMITSKETIHFPPNTGKTVHFPIIKYSTLYFTTSNNKQFFPSIPHTYISSKTNKIFIVQL